MPVVADDILDTYRQKFSVGEYTLEDHPYLRNEPVHSVFNAFRTAVMNIDPCVSESILKLYIAYKSERNFVDVVPQASRLRLSLNLRFHEIDDPRGLCRNVTNLGRWGNGEVEVILASVDELPYILGLVRQAFDSQMGMAGDE